MSQSSLVTIVAQLKALAKANQHNPAGQVFKDTADDFYVLVRASKNGNQQARFIISQLFYLQFRKRQADKYAAIPNQADSSNWAVRASAYVDAIRCIGDELQRGEHGPLFIVVEEVLEDLIPIVK